MKWLTYPGYSGRIGYFSLKPPEDIRYSKNPCPVVQSTPPKRKVCGWNPQAPQLLSSQLTGPHRDAWVSQEGPNGQEWEGEETIGATYVADSSISKKNLWGPVSKIANRILRSSTAKKQHFFYNSDHAGISITIRAPESTLQLRRGFWKPHDKSLENGGSNHAWHLENLAWIVIGGLPE